MIEAALVAPETVDGMSAAKIGRIIDALRQERRGTRRRANPAYNKVKHAIERARRNGDRAAVRQLRQQLRRHPSTDPDDPDYRREIRRGRSLLDADFDGVGLTCGAVSIRGQDV